MNDMSARSTALDVLIACRKDGAWVNGALKTHIVKEQLDARDAALATRLASGVMQNRLLLDFYLKQLLTGKLKDLQPIVRDILHLGLYQLLFMDKIPQSAAVNESVTLAKKYCRSQKNASGLVNGVLRNAVRSLDTLKKPTSLEDRYSHPKDLINLLRGYVGDARLENMLIANNCAPDTVVQVNTLKITTEALLRRLAEEGVTAENHGWMPDCLVLRNTGSLEKLPSFRDGLFYVQDAAAKLSVLCAELPQEDWRVLDCCAAPGGKSFAAAISMGGRGHITSCDIHEHKVALIQNGETRLGLTNITALQQDASVENPDWFGKMDAVIADVPCSGYGIIRKKPDIRYKNLQEMAELPALQLKILLQQANYVKPGGILLYSTCTLVRAENEELVASFLKERTDFSLEPLPLPAVFPKNTSGMLALVPGEYDTDGFFIARLRRKG